MQKIMFYFVIIRRLSIFQMMNLGKIFCLHFVKYSTQKNFKMIFVSPHSYPGEIVPAYPTQLATYCCTHYQTYAAVTPIWGIFFFFFNFCYSCCSIASTVSKSGILQTELWKDTWSVSTALFWKEISYLGASWFMCVKGNGKFFPHPHHKGPYGAKRYSSTHS